MAKKKKTKQYNKQELINKILGIFTNNVQQTLNYKQIASSLGIKDISTKRLIVSVLYDYTDSGLLEEISTGKFRFIKTETLLEGRVDMTSRGTAFIISADSEQDIFIDQKNTNRALHGDNVRIRLHHTDEGKRPEGEIVEIIKRKTTTFVGTLDISKNFAFLVSASKNMPFDIFIPLGKLNGAKNGDKAIAHIIEWAKKAKNPTGRIETVLGKPGDNDTEMHAILAEFNLPTSFPKRLDKEAKKIDDSISAEEIAKRRDYRDVTTFTIDPKDAKDFDDALSIKKLDNGNWEIGVHIADVTHFVKPDTDIEDEAYDRATSVYLVDRVVPMLPERLSNGVCSLRPNEEKLCFAVIFEINDNSEVLDSWIGRTVIKSNRRFTYEEAQEIIETEEGDFSSEVLTLDRLAKQIRAKRFEHGSIDFDRHEVKFNLDEQGKPLGVYFKISQDANKLIEEFMLLANKYVARFIGKKSDESKIKTFVYRIHDKPNAEKLESFNTFITKFGHSLDLNNKGNIAKSLNKLLQDVKGEPIQNLVETLAVRSMSKAVYSTENIGHYGLNFDHYSHFTSPIRRYPDMMVHRLLQHYLDGGKSENAEAYEEQCEHCSEMEQRAANAERSSIKYKQVEFMQDHLGEVFVGSISGVTEWGLYVEIDENKCEGMISIRDLNDDFYEFDKENYCIVGVHKHKKYTLGDKIHIKVGSANLMAKQLDFMIAK